MKTLAVIAGTPSGGIAARMNKESMSNIVAGLTWVTIATESRQRVWMTTNNIERRIRWNYDIQGITRG